MRSRRSSGFTLIELTVVLAVIVTLALVLTPAIGNYLSDARVSRTRSDTQTIASAIVQFYRDTGFFPQWSQSQSGGPGSAANKVDLLVGRGTTPSTQQPGPWTTGTTASLTDLLIVNTPGFTMRTAGAQFGWSGPYLNSAIEADPWGNRYAVNVGLLDPSATVVTVAGTVKNAVWVLSAGADATIATLYSQPTTTAALSGDDIGQKLQ